MEMWDSASSSYNSIAAVIYALYKNEFRYKGDKEWEFRTEDNNWQEDKKRMVLKKSLMQASAHATLRAMHWNDVGMSDPKADAADCAIMRDRLMGIALKLKTNSYQELILREAREYFICE